MLVRLFSIAETTHHIHNLQKYISMTAEHANIVLTYFVFTYSVSQDYHSGESLSIILNLCSVLSHNAQLLE